MSARARVRAAALAWAAAGIALAGACEGEETPLGPPRCEPPRELVLERFLKEGFRALADGQLEEAKIRFNAVLIEEAAHPEAQLGMRMAQRGGGITPSKGPGLEGRDGRAASRIAIAGELVPIDVPIDHTRLRFEDVATRRRFALAQGLDERKTPLDGWFTRRAARDGKPVEPTDRAAVAQRVDLIVLHDTRTQDALEAMAQMEASGASTHFLIDWDGTIYQTLDLGWEANHAHIDRVDHRSVAIDLVNPVALESAPLPPDAASDDPSRAYTMAWRNATRSERPLSEFVEVQGQEVQAWGYTAPQLASLGALVRALGEVLPAVPMQAPRDASGRVPRQFVGGLVDFVGVLGHLHLSPRAVDPGPGFDWERFMRDL